MTDVFISYARQDRDRAEKLARAIEQRGFSVWWDRKIPPGRSFEEVIQESLGKAGCVVVLWSHQSVKSDFVKDEAQRAADSGRLIPILVDEVPIPLGFGRIQTADLTSWREGEFHPQLEYVIESIAVFTGRGLVAEERTGFRVLPPLGPMGPSPARRPGELIRSEPVQVPVEVPPAPPAASAGKRPAVYAAFSVSVVSILAGAVVATYLSGLFPTVSAAGAPADLPSAAALVSTPAFQPEPVADPVADPEPEVDPVSAPEPEVDPEPVEEPGPTPAELRLEAVETFLHVRGTESEDDVDDRELLDGYRTLLSTHGEHLPEEQAETAAVRIAALEASLEAFEEARELDESDRATIVERLAGWRELEPARNVGPIASRARKRLEELGGIVAGAATIASPEDFVTCRDVGNMRPVGRNSRFRPGKVSVFARISAPRERDQVTFEWLSDDGTVLKKRPVTISRSLDGYRVYDSHTFGGTGVNEVRLYNSNGDLIGLASFEVRAFDS